MHGAPVGILAHAPLVQVPLAQSDACTHGSAGANLHVPPAVRSLQYLPGPQMVPAAPHVHVTVPPSQRGPWALHWVSAEQRHFCATEHVIPQPVNVQSVLPLQPPPQKPLAVPKQIIAVGLQS
jgi:hypothetical protein